MIGMSSKCHMWWRLRGVWRAWHLVEFKPQAAAHLAGSLFAAGDAW